MPHAAMAGDMADVVVQPLAISGCGDTGPIVTGDGSARLFQFNGWGGKYDLPAMTRSARVWPRIAGFPPPAANGCWRAARSTGTAPGWS